MTPDYMTRYTEDENGCWNYAGTINPAGYGQIRQTTAHRYFWETIRGPIPAGLQLDHLCRNKRCVNPSHLEPVTHDENQRRRAVLITHCPQGHEYTPENTVIKIRDGREKRSCRACHAVDARRWREKAKGSPLGQRGRPRKAS